MDSYIIPIHGVIGEKPKEDTSQDVYFSFTDFLIHFKKAKKFSVLIVDLKTPGGDVEHADNIIDALNASGKTIITRNSGDVMSAGVSILLTARLENRFYDPSKGEFLAHFPWGIAEGEADEIEEYAKMLRKLESRYVDMYSEITGTDKDIMRSVMAQNKSLTPEQVEEFGFATVVKEQKIKAIAMFNYKKNEMTNEQVEKKLGAIEAFMLKMSAYFKPKSLVIADTNGVELDFGSEITDPSQIVVGVKATVAGAPATGKYVMADGVILVFENSELMEKIEPQNGDMELLKKENEVLKAELEKYKTDAENQKAQSETVVAEIKGQFEKVQTEFMNFKKQYNQEPPKMNVPASQTGDGGKKQFSFSKNPKK